MKTLNLIYNYKKLLEQSEEQPMSGDATDVADIPAEEAPAPLTSAGEKMYIDLLFKAFVHSPTEDELNIINEIQAEYKDKNPKQVADVLRRLLEGDPKNVKDMLANIN